KTSTDGLPSVEVFLPLTVAPGATERTTFGWIFTRPSTKYVHAWSCVFCVRSPESVALHTRTLPGPVHWKIVGLPAIRLSRMTRSEASRLLSASRWRQLLTPAPPQSVVPSFRSATYCRRSAPSPASRPPLLLASPQAEANARGADPATSASPTIPARIPFHV